MRHLMEALQNLCRKKGEVREKALSLIVTRYKVCVEVEFAENNYVTLVYRCVALLKKGSPKEVSLAAQAIAMTAITLGHGDSTHEIYKDSIASLSEALKSVSESSVLSSILVCLAIVTFVGAKDFEETERSMQIIWKFIQRVALNVGAQKLSPSILAAALSAWAFLLTKKDVLWLSYKYWKGAISDLLDLIEDNDESIRTAVLKAQALINKSGCSNSFSSEAKCSCSCLIQEGNTSTNGYSSTQEMEDNILDRVGRLSLKDKGDKDHKKELLKVFEDDSCCKPSLMNWPNMLKSSAWCRSLQIKFMNRILGSEFSKHMQENKLFRELFEVVVYSSGCDLYVLRDKEAYEFFHELSEFVKPETEDVVSSNGCDLYELDTKEVVSGYYIPEIVKRNKSCVQRMLKSPNSCCNKARTQLLSKRRMLSEQRHKGHYLEDDQN